MLVTELLLLIQFHTTRVFIAPKIIEMFNVTVMNGPKVELIN